MLVAAKTYALISEYALICDMRLITREYGSALYDTLECCNNEVGKRAGFKKWTS